MTGRRVLVVTTHPPLPTNNGGRQRSNLLLRALASVAPTDLILLHDPALLPEGVTEAMRRDFGLIECLTPTPRGRRGPWAMVRGLRPGLVDRLAHNLGSRGIDYAADPAIAPVVQRYMAGGAYGAVVGRYLLPACKGDIARFHPCLLDIDDLDTSVYRTRMAAPGTAGWRRAVLARHLSQLERIVPRELSRFDHLWIVSEQDRGLIDHPRVSVLPNIPFAPGDGTITPLPADDGRPVILTVASWDHPPNHTGLSRFIERVWPMVLRENPDAVLRVVGSRMSDGQRVAWSAVPGVEVVGFVDSVADAYRDCAFTVSPVYEGGGTKIKVLESLAMGRTVALVPHSLRGFESHLRHGDSVWVGDSDRSLAEGCITLLRDAPLRRAMAQRGAAQVAEHYSFAALCRAVRESLAPLLAR